MNDEAYINPAVAEYKEFLKHLIDKRPSGLRGKLARSLGKHKSFVSQITSPNYPAPIPARHLETIFNHCQLSQTEIQNFKDLYQKAHGQLPIPTPKPAKTLTIELPVFQNMQTARDVEAIIKSFAADTIALAKRAEQPNQT